MNGKLALMRACRVEFGGENYISLRATATCKRSLDFRCRIEFGRQFATMSNRGGEDEKRAEIILVLNEFDSSSYKVADRLNKSILL